MNESAPQPTVLASLLGSRKLCVCLVGAGALHVALAGAGWGGWPCPFRAATGWPCPGCGLGLASAALLRGEVGKTLRLHAFAPAALVGMGLLLAGSILGGAPRERLISGVDKLEVRTHFAALVIVSMLVYWVARLILDGPHFLSLENPAFVKL